jgi:hypothetical protein
MAPIVPHGITELKTRLAENRRRISESLDAIETRVNLPQRIKADFQASPAKWIALAAGAGFAAKKLLPVLFRLAHPTLTRSALHTATLAAMPLIADALKQRFLPPSRALT